MYPIPLMNAIFHTLRSTKFISKIDLKSAYLKIPLEENSKPITAFTIPGKVMYQFKQMPFGLISSPETFQNTKNDFKLMIIKSSQSWNSLNPKILNNYNG